MAATMAAYLHIMVVPTTMVVVPTTTSNRIRITATDIGQSTNRAHQGPRWNVRPFFHLVGSLGWEVETRRQYFRARQAFSRGRCRREIRFASR